LKAIRDLSYPIYIEQDNVKTFQEVFSNHVNQSRAFVVTDDNVWTLHRQVFMEMTSNLLIETIVVKPGEQSKSFEVFESLIQTLINKQIKRDDVIIAFGGGVIGDLAGFVAASLFRGISLIHIPTTVLAQVDSSIGSKVGINVSSGKNLVGAFKDPVFVYTFMPFLNTLTTREFNNGMAEVIKAGAIYDGSIIDDLQQKSFDMSILVKAIMVKVNVVKKDKYEHELRMILNFGHTLGHAIEKAHNYDVIKHGEAISLGMKYALLLGEKYGITDASTTKTLLSLFDKYNLLNHTLNDINSYIEFMKVDKKQRQDGLKFVFIESIGKAVIRRLKEEDLYVN